MIDDDSIVIVEWYGMEWIWSGRIHSSPFEWFDEWNGLVLNGMEWLWNGMESSGVNSVSGVVEWMEWMSG